MVISLETFKRQGVNSPPEGTLGTTPTIGGLTFDTTNRLAGVTIKVPENLTGSVMYLELVCALMGAATAGDLLEFQADYIAIQSSNADQGNGDGGLLTKTSTHLTASEAVVAGTGNAGISIGAVYHVMFQLDTQDATNPYTKEDTCIHLEFSRVSVGGAGKVGNVLLIGVHVHYTGR
jgi:hypothetical protein